MNIVLACVVAVGALAFLRGVVYVAEHNEDRVYYW